LITKLATRIAVFIRNNNAQAASMDVLMFSLEVVLNALLVTITVLIVGLASGRFLDALMLLVAFVTLRFFSGGMHLPTSKLCNLISISIFLVLLFLPIPYWNVGFILNLLAFFLVIGYAPTKDIMHLNLLGPKYTMHFKIASILIVVSNFWLQSPELALAFFSQSLSLTPPAYNAVGYLERR